MITLKGFFKRISDAVASERLTLGGTYSQGYRQLSWYGPYGVDLIYQLSDGAILIDRCQENGPNIKVIIPKQLIPFVLNNNKHFKYVLSAL